MVKTNIITYLSAYHVFVWVYGKLLLIALLMRYRKQNAMTQSKMR